MASILSFSLLVIGFLFLVAIILIDVYADSLDYAWAWNSEDGYYKVYYYSFEKETLEMLKICQTNALGCHNIYYDEIGKFHMISLVKGHEFDYAIPGCNIYTHEMLHAWGYNEAMISDFFPCGITPKYHTLPRIGVT